MLLQFLTVDVPFSFTSSPLIWLLLYFSTKMHFLLWSIFISSQLKFSVRATIHGVVCHNGHNEKWREKINCFEERELNKFNVSSHLIADHKLFNYFLFNRTRFSGAQISMQIIDLFLVLLKLMKLFFFGGNFTKLNAYI